MIVPGIPLHWKGMLVFGFVYTTIVLLLALMLYICFSSALTALLFYHKRYYSFFSLSFGRYFVLALPICCWLLRKIHLFDGQKARKVRLRKINDKLTRPLALSWLKKTR